MNITRITPLILLSLLSACGGGGGGGGADSITAEPANNATPAPADTPPIDGESIELTQVDDGFLASGNTDTQLQALAAPSSHQFLPASAQAITIDSTNSSPCHLNIYSQYDINDNGEFVPDGDSKVIQANTTNCHYSGQLYTMNHWSTLLIEVIDSQLSDQTTYYEVTLHAGPIAITIN
jgi:hypothetical protein